MPDEKDVKDAPKPAAAAAEAHAVIGAGVASSPSAKPAPAKGAMPKVGQMVTLRKPNGTENVAFIVSVREDTAFVGLVALAGRPGEPPTQVWWGVEPGDPDERVPRPSWVPFRP